LAAASLGGHHALGLAEAARLVLESVSCSTDQA
jgi:hypothetical protein